MKLTIGSLIIQAQNAAGDHLNKMEFKKDSKKFLRDAAKQLELIKGSYDIRYNEGGIACSGDAILHSDGLYLHLNDFGFYWRVVKGRKDYKGEYNRQSQTHYTAEQLANSIVVSGVEIK